GRLGRPVRGRVGAATRASRGGAAVPDQRTALLDAGRQPGDRGVARGARVLARGGRLGHPRRGNRKDGRRADDLRRDRVGHARDRPVPLPRSRVRARLHPPARLAGIPRGLRHHPSQLSGGAPADAAAIAVLRGGAVGPHDLHWITSHLPEDGSVHISNATSSRAAVGLWGPRSRALLQRLTEEDVSNQAFPYMTSSELSIGGVPTGALRISYAGE